MITPLEERRAHSGSQFAVRVALLSGIALVAFAAIFFRLWYLQVLSGEEYLAQATDNRIREIKIQAPRGEILDANDKVLVANRKALSLQILPEELPVNNGERHDVIRELGGVMDERPRKIRREIRRQTKELPANPVTLQLDVDPNLALFLRERADRFPGIRTEEVYVRKYPQGAMAAHVLGYVTEINEELLEEPVYSDLVPGDRIGRDGVEFQYDQMLRGQNGAIRVQVDAQGNPVGRTLAERAPQPGNDLKLTIDKRVQAAGESALSTYSAGLRSSFVAMSVDDGAILGMGSSPTYEPEIFTPPADTDAVEAIFAPDGLGPANNYAISGQFPTGSTFKLVTALAGLEEGIVTTATTIADAGVWEWGGVKWQNAGEQPYGSVDLGRALEVSSDIYFYMLARDAIYAGDGEAIQKWATELGFGAPTGIDLPNELGGFVPSEDAVNEKFEEGLFLDGWVPGQNLNFSIGQGFFTATPLQLALAYATVGNGGSLVRPHVAERVVSPSGETVQDINPEPRRDVEINPAYRQAIMDGLTRAANGPEGTSTAVFGNYPIEIAGKTGTAERPDLLSDQSWYAALAPADDPEVVVIVTVEGGGFGADTAAPAAKEILSAYFPGPQTESGPAPVAADSVE